MPILPLLVKTAFGRFLLAGAKATPYSEGACPPCEGVQHGTYFEHPERLPKNVEGPFYTLGERSSDGQWWSMCMQCNVPQAEAPTLLAPLTGTNDDTYFIRQPETDAEIEQACRAMEVRCTSALRYGGHDPKIIARLRGVDCDHALGSSTPLSSEMHAAKHWWTRW